jgi:ABC-type lipoprotein export system ATPase subunit
MTMIELCAVSKTFNAGQHNQFTAVDKVDLEIRPGHLTILKGPSGSGKTTLLSIIGCMARPSSGRIKLHGIRTSFFSDGGTVEGLDITSLPERFLTEIRRTTFGFIFQQFNLVKGISALENIMLPAYPTGERQSVFRQRALELMELLSVSRHAASPVEWLSGLIIRLSSLPMNRQRIWTAGYLRNSWRSWVVLKCRAKQSLSPVTTRSYMIRHSAIPWWRCAMAALQLWWLTGDSEPGHFIVDYSLTADKSDALVRRLPWSADARQVGSEQRQ